MPPQKRNYAQRVLDKLTHSGPPKLPPIDEVELSPELVAQIEASQRRISTGMPALDIDESLTRAVEHELFEEPVVSDIPTFLTRRNDLAEPEVAEAPVETASIEAPEETPMTTEEATPIPTTDNTETSRGNEMERNIVVGTKVHLTQMTNPQQALSAYIESARDSKNSLLQAKQVRMAAGEAYRDEVRTGNAHENNRIDLEEAQVNEDIAEFENSIRDLRDKLVLLSEERSRSNARMAERLQQAEEKETGDLNTFDLMIASEDDKLLRLESKQVEGKLKRPTPKHLRSVGSAAAVDSANDSGK